MTIPNGNQELCRGIEQLIQEHLAAVRKSAQDAIARAFASPARAQRTNLVRPSRSAQRRLRASSEIADLGERFFEAVRTKPGETMIVLSAEVGVSARELYRSVVALRRAGRVRSVGSRHLTRYFPMNVAAASG